MLGTLAINAPAGEVHKGIYREVAVMSGFFGDVAIRGYDSVAYFTDGKALPGSDAITYKWIGATWPFASDACRRPHHGLALQVGRDERCPELVPANNEPRTFFLTEPPTLRP
jgi:hypothetical protein